jgi:hypothetical protein
MFCTIRYQMDISNQILQHHILFYYSYLEHNQLKTNKN